MRLDADSGVPHVPGRKALWSGANGSLPDNHTSSTFLHDLVINADVPHRRYWHVVLESAVVVQQASCVVCSIAAPLHLLRGSLSVRSLLSICAVLLFIGYGLVALLSKRLLGGSLVRGIRQCFLLIGGLYCLAPLMRTLTRTTSEDSVIALTILLLFIHLFFHDYGYLSTSTTKLTGAVSLSAAMIAAVLVASRLYDDHEAFAHILLALELFLLSPFVRRSIRGASQAAHIAVTFFMLAASISLAASLSQVAAVLVLTSALLLSFVCPVFLTRLNRFKAKIGGPWDEANPVIPTEMILQRQ